MRYLQKFNERFYYNLDNEIDIFIKSYYDLLLNLKQLIENGSVGLNYYVDNIKSCFTTLLKTFISNFGEKKYNKFKNKIEELKDTINDRVTRTLQQIKDGLKNAGFIGDVISELPNKKDEKRFQEVSEYIKKNNITNYIIIDDQNHDIEKATNLKTNLCKPSIKTGFTSSDLKKCISILSGNQ